MISGTAAAPARLRVTRRGIQIVLGLLWLLDGLLQFQRAMLTPKFAVEVIAPAGAGEPGFIAGPVGELVRIILHQPVMMDVAFGLIQLALGAGILYARTARRALAASVAWAVLVWYLGEGLGGLAGGSSSLLTGAPGAALLYAVLALAAWPRHDGGGCGGQAAPVDGGGVGRAVARRRRAPAASGPRHQRLHRHVPGHERVRCAPMARAHRRAPGCPGARQRRVDRY